MRDVFAQQPILPSEKNVGVIGELALEATEPKMASDAVVDLNRVGQHPRDRGRGQGALLGEPAVKGGEPAPMCRQQTVGDPVAEHPALVHGEQAPTFGLIRIKRGERADGFQSFLPVPPHEVALLLDQGLEQQTTRWVGCHELPQPLVVVVHDVAHRAFHGQDCEHRRIGKPELTSEHATRAAMQHGGTLLHGPAIVRVVVWPAEPGPQHQRIESLEECARCVGGSHGGPR